MQNYNWYLCVGLAFCNFDLLTVHVLLSCCVDYWWSYTYMWAITYTHFHAVCKYRLFCFFLPNFYSFNCSVSPYCKYILNRSGGSRKPCLSPISEGKYCLSSLRVLLAIDFLYTLITDWRVLGRAENGIFFVRFWYQVYASLIEMCYLLYFLNNLHYFL